MTKRSILSIAIVALSLFLTSCVDNSSEIEEAALKSKVEQAEREAALKDEFSVAPLSDDCPNCGAWSTGDNLGKEGFLHMQVRTCTSGSTTYKQYREIDTSGPSCSTIARCYCSPWSSKWGLVVKQCVTVASNGSELWSAAIWMNPNVPGGTWPTDAQICP